MVKYCKTRNDRIWKLGQQKARRCSQDIAREIEKTKKGLNSEFLTQSLKCLPNFIGCYAENQLSSLVITQYPTFLIVNTDSSQMKGSHWLAIGVFKTSIEIFDPLGFTIFNWSRVPCSLLDFLHRMSVTRRVQVSSRVQPSNSHLCGFYCIFYLILRSFVSMRTVNSFFCLLHSKLYKNDSILYKFFK